jgi:hypothetical protein
MSLSLIMAGGGRQFVAMLSGRLNAAVARRGNVARAPNVMVVATANTPAGGIYVAATAKGNTTSPSGKR